MDPFELFFSSPETVRTRNACKLAIKYFRIPKAFEEKCPEFRRPEVRSAIADYHRDTLHTGRLLLASFGLTFLVSNSLIKWSKNSTLITMNRFKFFTFFFSFAFAKSLFLPKLKLEYEKYSHILEPLFENPEVRRMAETPITNYKLQMYREIYETPEAESQSITEATE